MRTVHTVRTELTVRTEPTLRTEPNVQKILFKKLLIADHTVRTVIPYVPYVPWCRPHRAYQTYRPKKIVEKNACTVWSAISNF